MAIKILRQAKMNVSPEKDSQSMKVIEQIITARTETKKRDGTIGKGATTKLLQTTYPRYKTGFVLSCKMA